MFFILCCIKQIEGKDAEVTVIQRGTEQWITGFKCSVKLHRKSYYCGLLSYAKPILSAEQEETLLISAQECSSMADTSKFRTPRRNHLKPIAVPGETYITEFENGYQDTVEGGVQCKRGATMRDGSVLDNIITHAVYVVTITQEKFKRIGNQMFTGSSRNQLRCTSRGEKGALGCVGSLHTYYGSHPKTEGGGNTVFQTNVRDIRLAGKKRSGSVKYETRGKINGGATRISRIRLGGVNGTWSRYSRGEKIKEKKTAGSLYPRTR